MTEQKEKNAMTGDIKTVSWHEAAHAVMLISTGREFDHVTIQRGKGFRGHVELLDTEINGLFELVGAVECLLAGSIAQAHLANRPIAVDRIHGKDRHEITRLLKENQKIITRNESPHFMQWVLFRAHLHLVQRFPAVERIATALQATKTLSYQECKELMND